MRKASATVTASRAGCIRVFGWVMPLSIRPLSSEVLQIHVLTGGEVAGPANARPTEEGPAGADGRRARWRCRRRVDAD